PPRSITNRPFSWNRVHFQFLGKWAPSYPSRYPLPKDPKERGNCPQSIGVADALAISKKLPVAAPSPQGPRGEGSVRIPRPESRALNPCNLRIRKSLVIKDGTLRFMGRGTGFRTMLPSEPGDPGSQAGPCFCAKEDLIAWLHVRSLTGVPVV